MSPEKYKLSDKNYFSGKPSRRLTSILLSAAMVLSIITMPASAITAISPGQVEIEKTAGAEGNREYTVTLTVDGNKLTTPRKTDVVLVLDISASMNEELTSGKSRLDVLKEAATAFVTTVLPSGSNNQVAVVTYSMDVASGSNWNDGSIIQSFSTNASTINTSINNLGSVSYTNMEAGFYHADAAMDSSRADADKLVIYMTDGVANRWYNDTGATQGSGTGFNATAASEAIGAAEALKTNHAGTKIYTIGLISGTIGNDVKTVLDPDPPHNYPEEYYQVTTADGLSAIYSQLADEIITQIATDSVVTDVIEDGFSYVAGSLSASAGTSAQVTGTPPETETVTWTIGSINEDLKTLTFRVRADDPVYGAAYTNDSAELTFKPVAENTLYTPGADGYFTLTYPQPVVPVPPIAVDDVYSVNTGSTLTVPGPGVLGNDLSTDQRDDGGWTSTPVSGSVTVVTPPTHGSLTQNADGSFTYTPAAGYSGVDTYVYKIFTDVTIPGGGTTRLEDSATVTITCNSAYLIKVHKTDAASGADLSGVVFKLYDSTKAIVLETLSATDADGISQTASTYSTGTYYLKEFSVPAGYDLDATYYAVNIASGNGTLTVDISNTRTKYPIGVTKKDAVDGSLLAGVYFGLYDTNTDGAVLLEALPATDAAGYAQSTNTYAPGTYYLKEITTIDGYVLDTEYHAVVVALGQAGGVASITVDNNRTPYKIGVTKLDAVNDTPLPGVIFELFDSNTDNAVLLYRFAATNTSGYAESTMTFAPGTYYLKEFSTIDGYELDTAFHAVVVAVGQTGGAAVITVDNNRTPYKIGVTKIDAVDDSPLTGVIFGLYDTNTTGAVLLDTFPATNAAGYAESTKTFAPGTYYLREISTINGYVLDTAYHAVVVAIGQTGGAAVITVENSRTAYPVGVNKIDEISGAPLEGVVFGLYSDNSPTATLLDTFPATDDLGYAQSTKNFAPGLYYLKEHTTVNGYELDTGYHAVTVALGQMGEIAVITVDNSRTPYKIGVTKLDAVSAEPLAGVVFGLYDSNSEDAALLYTFTATNASGYAESAGTYAPGTYYLKEISTINGYELDTTFHAVVVAVGQSGAVASISVDNNRTPYKIGVTKIDAVDDEPLAGVIFGLYDSNTTGAALLNTFPATNAAGYAESTKTFAPGTYYLKEISTINGYVIDTAYHAVTVAIGQTGGAAVITVENSRTAYPVGVYKIDEISKAHLEGVIFGLYDDNSPSATLLDTFPATNSSGYAQSTKDFAPGTYFLRELSTINGYVLDTLYHNVVVSVGQAGGVAVITVDNTRTPYPIGVYKYDWINESALEGVVFGLYNNNTSAAELLYTFPATNASGYAESSEDFAPGTYYLKELTTISGYVLDTSFYEVEVGIGQEYPVSIINVYNARTPYPVGVIKLDEISGDPLEGVVFGLYGENIPNQAYSSSKSFELVSEQDMTLLEELSPTDANGYARTVGAYAPGTYYLKEISTINGYVIDTAYHAVTVAIGQPGGAAVITVENSRTPYPIGVNKIDEISEAPLEGVVFGLYNDNSPSATLLDTLPATDSSGYAQSTKDFAPGTYFLRELSTINGYVLDTLYHNVVVSVGQAGGAAVITVDNTRTAYPIGVYKYDGISESPLQGVVFGLYNNNTSAAELLYTFPATNASGYAESSEDFAPGTYYLKELKAINGYVLDTAYHAVEVGIGQADQVSSINLYNSRTPYPIGVIKLDEISSNPLEGVVFELYGESIPEPAIDAQKIGELISEQDMTLLEELPPTDADGYAQTAGNYAPGTYFLKEMSTINGYVIDTEYHTVEVAVGQADGVAVITISNARTPYLAGINKVDAASGAPLQGVIFALYNNNTPAASLLETLPATNAEGYAQTVDTYAPGTYYLKEISTVSGYDLDPAYHILVIGIGQAGGVSVITLDNSKTPVPGISVLKTVQNVTSGSAAGKAATGTAGDDFVFTISVTNSGETELTDVIITDSKAVVGTNVTVDGILTKWSAGTDKAATITLDSLAVDQTVKITYAYNTASTDPAMTLSNVVLVDGTAPAPLGKVNATDTAKISITAVLGVSREPTKAPTPAATPTTAVLGAARTGETDNMLVGIFASLLLLGASAFMLIRIRSSRKSDIGAEDKPDDPDQGDI